MNIYLSLTSRIDLGEERRKGGRKRTEKGREEEREENRSFINDLWMIRDLHLITFGKTGIFRRSNLFDLFIILVRCITSYRTYSNLSYDTTTDPSPSGNLIHPSFPDTVDGHWTYYSSSVSTFLESSPDGPSSLSFLSPRLPSISNHINFSTFR